MRDFVRPGAYDLALNVYTSFGYFEDAVENRRVLENIFASLKPGGAFVIDLLGTELLATRYQPTRSESLPDGTILVHRTLVLDDWTRIEGEWILLEGGNATTFRIRHWLYSGREIRAMLAGVGFTKIALYGSFEGIPYDPQAQRLIAVGRKPGE